MSTSSVWLFFDQKPLPATVCFSSLISPNHTSLPSILSRNGCLVFSLPKSADFYDRGHRLPTTVTTAEKRLVMMACYWGAKRLMFNSKTFYVIFQKRVRVFHRGFKQEKTDESTRPQAERFYCFRVFETSMKHEAWVFEITSPTKEISLNYHLNKFSQFNYYIWDVKYAWTS